MRRCSSLRPLTRSIRLLATAALKMTLNSNLDHSLVQYKHRNEHVDPRTIVSSVYSLQELDHRNTSCTQTSARTALPLFTLDWWPRLTSVQSTFGYYLLWGNLTTTFDQMEVQSVLLMYPSWKRELGQPRHWLQWRLSHEECHHMIVQYLSM